MTHPTIGSVTSPVKSPVPARSRWLAWGAVAGPVLFTLAWLVLGFLSPGYTIWGTRIAPYSPISQPISGLGMGATAPYMNAAFILGGLLLLAGVIGVPETTNASDRPAFRRASTALLVLTPLGMMIDGIFNLEAMMLHLLGFLLAIGTPVVSFLAVGLYLRGIPRWRRFGGWLLLGSPLTLLLLVAFFQTFEPTVSGAQHGVAGLIQRLLAIEVLAWFVAMGWLASRPRMGVRAPAQGVAAPAQGVAAPARRPA